MENPTPFDSAQGKRRRPDRVPDRVGAGGVDAANRGFAEKPPDEDSERESHGKIPLNDSAC